MRPDDREIDWHRIAVRGGSLFVPLAGEFHEVGERMVPSPLVLHLHEPEAPTIEMKIEVVNQVPRLVELHITRVPSGREIRKKDLNLNIEDLIEQTVAIASSRTVTTAGEMPRVAKSPAAFPPEEQIAEIRRGIRTVQNVRARSQRPMTDDRLRQVATLYQAQDSGGIEAVAAVYNVHRATAARWVAKAREADWWQDEGVADG